jgi:hypothetical protein
MGSIVELRLPIEQQKSLSIPVPDLVTVLEDYLNQAKNGHLRAMAFVCVTDSGEVYAGTKSAMDEAHRMTMLGGLTILSQRLSLP